MSSGNEKNDFKKKEGRSLNLLKESLVLNGMDMEISKKNVLIT